MKVDQLESYELRRPKNPAWLLNYYKAPVPTRHEVWDHTLNFRVITTIEFTNKSRGVELHLSISEYGGKYPQAWMIERVRKDFCAEDFELDDHGSKVAHLWLPIDKDKRGDCDCKD